MEKTRVSKAGVWLLAALLILAGSVSYTLRFHKVRPERMADFSSLPYSKSDWQSQEIIFSDQTYEILKATSTTMRVYTAGNGASNSLFVGYFADQKYGSQIHSPRQCLPGGGWGIMSHRRPVLDIHGRRLPVNRLILGQRAERQLVYYWFETRSGILTNEFGLKFDLFKNSLLMRPTDAAMVRLMVAIPPGQSEKFAEETLNRFLAEFLPEIEKSLPFGT